MKFAAFIAILMSFSYAIAQSTPPSNGASMPESDSTMSPGTPGATSTPSGVGTDPAIDDSTATDQQKMEESTESTDENLKRETQTEDTSLDSSSPSNVTP